MAIDIEKFQKAIVEFKKITNPTNLLSLLGDEELVIFLREGYTFDNKTTVAVYFNKGINESIELENYDNENLEKSTYPFNSTICQRYRDLNIEECKRCDKRIALKYYNKEWTQPVLYRCHLQVWDMAYPLKVNNAIIGVLFSGQAVIKFGEINLKDELSNIWDNVKLFPFENKENVYISDQRIDILHAINKDNYLSFEQKSELIGILEELPHQKEVINYVESDQLIKQFNKFINFGEMINKLLHKLHITQKEIAAKNFMQEFSYHLALTDIRNKQYWSQDCIKLYKSFQEIDKFEFINVYLRNGGKFKRSIPYPYRKSLVKELKVRDVLSAIDTEKITQLSEKNYSQKNLLEKLGLGKEHIWAFRSQHQKQAVLLSSLIIVKGDVAKENIDLFEDFCRIIATRADITSYIFLLNEQQDAFRTKVNDMAHAFRTPLQSIYFDIDEIYSSTQDKNVNDILIKTKRKLFEAKVDLQVLLDQNKEYPGVYNIVELVDEIIEDMTPIAKRHPCKIVKLGKWPEEINVFINKYKIKHALVNLLDNAIKYSFRAKWRHGIYSEYEVRIRLNVLKDDYLIQIIYQNYGIGIPPEKLKSMEIWKPYQRANISDDKKMLFDVIKLNERKGSGLGLFIAQNSVLEHDGWIEIRSEPADNEPHKKKEEFHRYVTTVTVYLPII